ncbi:hypothetical protein Tco_0814570 [Tanacetum coccineum]
MDSVVCISNNITPVEFDECLEENHNKKRELSEINMTLPPRDQRHQYLRFEGLEYTDVDIADFEERMLMEHMGAQVLVGWARDEGQELFTSHAWRRLFEIKGPLVREFMLEFFSTCRMSDAELGLDEADTLCFQLGGARRRMTKHRISSEGDFFGITPSYTAIRDPMLRLCHRGMDVGSINIHYLLARYLRRFASRRYSGDTPKPERQPDAAVGSLEVTRMLQILTRVLRLFQNPYRHLSHLLQQLGLGLCHRGPRWKEIDNVGEVLIIYNSFSFNQHGESTE